MSNARIKQLEQEIQNLERRMDSMQASINVRKEEISNILKSSKLKNDVAENVNKHKFQPAIIYHDRSHGMHIFVIANEEELQKIKETDPGIYENFLVPNVPNHEACRELIRNNDLNSRNITKYKLADLDKVYAKLESYKKSIKL
ncbi:hypothetical protein [Proteus mirabilis]|uniref:hypothetical protein n=1 Tax=Proteus mirabilis TaxID=584 RepID=UPI0034D45372